MKTYKLLLGFFVLIGIVLSCQKEKSFERGTGVLSNGSLQSGATGDCLGNIVSGTYKKDTALNSTDYVDVTVDVTTAGSYSISTDTINGFYFSAFGTFGATGVNTVRLQGNGTPAAGGTNIFTVTYDSSQCTFSINTLVGGGTSVFTLEGAPDSCSPGTVVGTYIVGTPLDGSTNTVTVQVNVTTAGTYSIVTSTVNGMTFSGSGTFSGTGAQLIVLSGNGTPAAAGSFTIPVTVGSSTCSFTLTLSPIDYFPRTTNSNWSYEYDNDPLDTLFQNVIPQTQSALGNTYNIFMFNDGSGIDTLGYYRKASGDYYQYLDVGFFFQLDNESWGEYIFLKDNVPVNTTWTSNSFSNTITDSTGTFPINVRFKETIQQKDVPITVRGTTYQNTIVVKEEYEYSFDGGVNWTALPDYSMNYYSRNIGLIKIEFTDNSGNGGSYVQELTRYQVF